MPTCNVRVICLARKCAMLAKAETLSCSYCIQIFKFRNYIFRDICSSHSISIAKSRVDWTCKEYEDKGNKPLRNRPL